MKKLSTLLLILSVLSLSSCTEKSNIVVIGETEPVIIEATQTEEKEMIETEIEVEKEEIKETEPVVEEVKQIEVEQKEEKETANVEEKEVMTEDDSERFLGVAELDWAQAIYDTKEKIFWENVTSPKTMQWSTAEKWVEPILADEGYVFTVEQTLLDSPAFSYCLDKWEGWRLPLKKEMSTLVDDSSSLVSITESLYWTWEQVGDTNTSWIADFGKWEMRESTTDDEVYVVCVHNEIDLTWWISDEEFEAQNVQ